MLLLSNLNVGHVSTPTQNSHNRFTKAARWIVNLSPLSAILAIVLAEVLFTNVPDPFVTPAPSDYISPLALLFFWFVLNGFALGIVVGSHPDESKLSLRPIVIISLFSIVLVAAAALAFLRYDS